MNVLDASALLAFLFREPGHECVEAAIEDCCLSSVNLAEVLGRFAHDGHDPLEAARRLRSGPIEIVPFTENHAVLAAALLPATLPFRLSPGDRACLALAIEREASALTADQAWAELDLPVPIVQIRSGSAP